MNRAFTYILTLGLLMIGGGVMGQRTGGTSNNGGGEQTQAHGVIVGGSVFGGGNLANVAGSSSVTISQTQLSDRTQVSASIAGDVYGGGAKALVNTASTSGNVKTTSVTLSNGTVQGDIYGGGLGYLANGAEDDPTTAFDESSDFEANVSGPVTVTISGGSSRNVFGCNNLKGAPQSTVEVNVNGGTISQNVFGGGNLASTPNTVAPEVNIDGGIVGNDVYGGGALADVGGTTVNIMGGTVSGDIYGGALGDAYHNALVNGKVTVNIGSGTPNPSVPGGIAANSVVSGSAIIGGSVYGCNNAAGTPKDDVEVNIFKTNHETGGNDYPSSVTTLLELSTLTAGYESTDYLNKFAIKAVYGGGNKASYIPAATSTGVSTKCITVNIYGCSENTIQTVYGGGNAADVGVMADPDNNVALFSVNTNLNVYGGFIDRVFGGGNGYSGSTPPNHTDPTQPEYNPGANISGTATTQIHGGLFRQIFGGSNQFGDVGATALTLEKTCDYLLIKESFGGANEADITGNVTTTLACSDIEIGSFYGGSNLANINGSVTLNVYGGIYSNVFGGSKGRLEDSSVTPHITEKSANIDGNVTLNLYGGSIENAFGGCDVKGNITGNITVNVFDLEKNTCELSVNNVYGGGRNAAYEPDDITEGVKPVSPVVNMIHGTVSKKTDGTGGNVFGGAYGASATVTANPKVNIGYDATTMSGSIPTSSSLPEGYTLPTTYVANVTGNVYGGGDLAAVSGGTMITIQKASMNDATTTIGGSVYGGGNEATVSGATTVTMTNGTVTNDVYGGGALADVGTAAVTGSNPVAATQHNVTVSNGSVRTVYGGGMGRLTAGQVQAKAATVNGEVGVTISDGNISSGVYGGCNVNGTVVGGTTVGINGGTIGHMTNGSDVYGAIYGGGLGENTNVQGSVALTVGASGNPTINGDVYGGSAQGLVNCTFNASNAQTHTPGAVTGVTITNGIINGDVYGGGHGLGGKTANVWGPVTVNVNGGSINTYGENNAFGGNVFGCNNAAGAPQSTVQVNINNNVTKNVYGGGNLAAYSSPLNTNNVHTDYPEVNINNGTMANVFGGGKGNPNDASGETAKVTGNPKVTIGDGTSSHSVVVSNNVYGGGDAANVGGNAIVVYNDNNSNSTVKNLFGGGNAAGVTGTTQVTMTQGKVTDGLYGGCNTKGTVGGDITVALNGGTVGTDGGPTADVYGGGFGASTSTSGDIGITLEGTTINGDLYGGSAFGGVNASTENTTTITVGSNTLNGIVFGGGKGDVEGEQGHSNITAVSKGNVLINYNIANTDLAGLYGGANVNGNVKGNIVVNVLADVGTSGNGGSIDIFGGGLGSETNTEGNVTVNIGNLTGPAAPTIYGDIYGGSALGNVNNGLDDLTTVNVLNGILNGNVFGGGLGDRASIGNNHSDVAALVNGTVKVNIGATDGGTTPTYTGNATINGNVYGCNNTNGSPQGDVAVNIYKTAHTTENTATYQGNNPTYAIANVFGGGKQADYAPENNSSSSTKKATVHVYNCTNTIEDLFGGGDAAAALGVVTIVDGGRFDRVFGGGNGETSEANIGAGGTNLQVHGGYINQLFGGSNKNGSISGAMSVSVDNTSGCGEDIHEFFGGSNEVVIGDSEHPVNLSTTINCGTKFGDVYGGSNLADIYGNVTLTINGGEMANVYAGSKGRLADNTVTPNITAQAANINGNVTLHVYGGKITNAYGGSNLYGNITGAISVDLDWSQTTCTDAKSIGNIYGGSNLAQYKPTYTPTSGSVRISPEVHIKHGTVTHSVFGGGYGESAKVIDASPKVTIGDADTEPYAIVSEDVFGGGDLAEVNNGGTTLLIQGAHSSVRNIYGGGNKAHVSSATTVNVNGGTVTQDVYGGGALANVGGSNVTLSGGTVRTLYGGGMGNTTTAALVDNNAQVTVSGGTINGYKINTTGPDIYGGVFGGCNVKGTVKGGSTVQITGAFNTGTNRVNVYGGGLGESTNVVGTVAVSVGANVNGDVYGGSAKGLVNYVYNNDVTPTTANSSATTTVTLTGGAVTGDIYGGGHGLDNQLANVGGPVTVTVSGGSANNVFGANNLLGAPQSGTIQVNISNGTVNQDVYGGGNEAATEQPTQVTVGGGQVKRDVYGGGAYASTGATTVNITAGTIGTSGTTTTGNVYGGGLGGGTHEPSVGTVTVNIGAAPATTGANPTGDATILGSVYGCNNAKGSPTGDVTVHVWKTHQEGQTLFSGTAYAIDQVFGGGNQADFTGTYKAYVYIHGCENTIRRVFGGGNNADAYGVETTIDGGRFDYVFGGGNGEGDGNEANIGEGGVILTIMGGKVNQFFGGSNQHGEITGPLTVSATSGSCDLDVENFFCGSNQVYIGGSVNTTIECVNGMNVTNLYGGSNLADIGGSVTLTVKGGTYTNVFGGSKGRLASTGVEAKAADITHDVTLNLYGGTIENAFGGSDVYGNIGGKITVNVIDDGSMNTATPPVATCPLVLNNVYGGGRDAAYTPTDAVALSPNFSPEVNIIHGAVTKKAIIDPNTNQVTGYTGGNVFGGGLGATAVATSNPKVTIGYGTGYTYPTNATTPSAPEAEVAGNVYGGGDQAAVMGNTVVNIQKSNTTVGADVYGGGNKALVSKSTAVSVTDGVVTGDVYGGGALADVNTTGGTNPTLTSGATTSVSISGGQVKDVYGGGLGSNESSNIVAAKVFGPVSVTIDGGSVQNVYGCNNENGAPQNNVTVNINNSVTGNVYGGGNLASYTAPDVTTERPYNPVVSINNGTIANVFGGGNGDDEDLTGETAKVIGHPIVTIGDSESNHKAIVTNVYGGGNAANVGGNTKVTYNDNNSTSTVAQLFGGGNAAGVTGTTEVNMTLGKVTSGIFGGCNSKGTVGGDITVNVTGGTVGTSATSVAYVYGGGYGSSTSTTGNVEVNIGAAPVAPSTTPTGNAIIYGDVYGGSADGSVNSSANNSTDHTWVTLYAGTINGSLYGGGMGIDNTNCNVNGDVRVTVNGGSILTTTNTSFTTGSVFGCNNVKGAPKKTVLVNINNDVAGSVYGGGNLAQYVAPAGNLNYPQVNILNGTLSGDVFGGGLGNSGDQGKVTGNPQVTINGANAIVNGTNSGVYGGGSVAPTQGNPVVTLTTGTVANIYGGGKAASVTGATTVNVNGGTVDKTGTTDTGNVYGGCNSSGTVSSTTNVNITNGTVEGSVFGGGKGGPTQVTGKATVIISGSYTAVNGDVFGGGDEGVVNGGTDVQIKAQP